MFPVKQAVKSYSYSFKLTYGTDPSLDIQDGYQIQGSINGYTINNCTYNSSEPIGDFVTCVVNAIKEAPNVKRVNQKIGSEIGRAHV